MKLFDFCQSQKLSESQPGVMHMPVQGEPRRGDFTLGQSVRTLQGTPVTGVVERISQDSAYIRTESGKIFKTPLNNIQADLNEGVTEADALQGTPVVSLDDFDDDKDYTQDRYGRRVPKKLTPDDPRVKFYKERTIHIKKSDWQEFSDWMESEGLGFSAEDGVTHRDLGDVIELAYPPHDPRNSNLSSSYAYAGEWDVRDQQKGIREVTEGLNPGFDPDLAQTLKQREYTGPVPLKQLGKNWIEAIGDVVDHDDLIMVQGNDPEYDSWVAYVPGLGKYAYGAEMGYTTGNAQRVERDTRDHGMSEAWSDPSGILAAAKHDRSFIVTAEVDGKKRKFRVRHQNANLAREKFVQHHSQAKVLDVQEEGVTEGDTLDTGPDGKLTAKGEEQMRRYREQNRAQERQQIIDKHTKTVTGDTYGVAPSRISQSRNEVDWDAANEELRKKGLDEQGVAGGSEKRFMIYFVVPEHDDYPDRREPTEQTIVVANSAGEAAKKFKAETPEAHIKDIVAMRQDVAEGSADMEWHGSNTDMKWYDAYKDQPVRVKVKNHSGLGGKPSGTFKIRSFKKIGPSKAELTITFRGEEMTGTVDLDNPETVVNKMYDIVPAMNFYIGSMPATARQAFNLFQYKNKKQGEDGQQIDELRDETLQKYRTRATGDVVYGNEYAFIGSKASRRKAGIKRAGDKLSFRGARVPFSVLDPRDVNENSPCGCDDPNHDHGSPEPDHEVNMAKADLYKLAKYALKLHDMLRNVPEVEGIQGWQQAKITKAADYISSVYHSLDYDTKFDETKKISGKKITEGRMKDIATHDLMRKLKLAVDQYNAGTMNAERLSELTVKYAQRIYTDISTDISTDTRTPPHAVLRVIRDHVVRNIQDLTTESLLEDRAVKIKNFLTALGMAASLYTIDAMSIKHSAVYKHIEAVAAQSTDPAERARAERDLDALLTSDDTGKSINDILDRYGFRSSEARYGEAR